MMKNSPKHSTDSQKTYNEVVKHRWWHFIYGKDTERELVRKGRDSETYNCWYVCKKCKQQIGEKQGYTTFSFELDLIAK